MEAVASGEIPVDGYVFYSRQGSWSLKGLLSASGG